MRARTGDETTCAVFDPNGPEWLISPDQPIRELDTFCKASCIDVPRGHVHVSGYSDLRRAPLVAKLRTVANLHIDVDRMKDLAGLEGVDITEQLWLSIIGADASSFTSLDGLTDRTLSRLFMTRLMGLREVSGSRFEGLTSFSAEQSGMERIDLSMLPVGDFNILGMTELTSLKLGGGRMESVSIRAADNLPAFTWEPGLTVKTFYIANNSKLSSCLVEDFYAAANLGPASTRVIGDNGPCP